MVSSSQHQHTASQHRQIAKPNQQRWM